MINRIGPALLMLVALAAPALGQTARYFELPPRSAPHDVAPAPDGMVWYTAQRTGHLGRWKSHAVRDYFRLFN